MTVSSFSPASFDQVVHPELYVVDFKFDDEGFDGQVDDVVYRDPNTGQVRVYKDAFNGKAHNIDGVAPDATFGAGDTSWLSSRLDITKDGQADRASFRPTTSVYGHGDMLVFLINEGQYKTLEQNARRTRQFGDPETRVDFNHDGQPDYAEQNGNRVLLALNHKDVK